VTTGVLQAVEKRSSETTAASMPVKFPLMSLSGTATTNAGRSSVPMQRIAAEFSGLLHAPHKGALQSFSYKGILIRAVISLRSQVPLRDCRPR